MSSSAAGTPTSACRSMKSPARWPAWSSDFPGVRFMVFGFGERAYLMARRAGSAEMLTALFPSTSAILMTALRASPTEAFADQQVVDCFCRQDAGRPDRRSDLADRWKRARMAQRYASPMVLIPAASSMPRPKPMMRSTRATPGPRRCCTTRGCPIDPHGVLFAGQVMQQVGSDRDVAGSAAALISRAGASHSGTRRWSLAARRRWCDDGGGGLLLLKLRHPASRSGRSNANRRQRMAGFLATSRGFTRTRYQWAGVPQGSIRCCARQRGERADLLFREAYHGRRMIREEALYSAAPPPPYPASAGEGEYASAMLGLCFQSASVRTSERSSLVAGFSRLPLRTAQHVGWCTPQHVRWRARNGTGNAGRLHRHRDIGLTG